MTALEELSSFSRALGNDHLERWKRDGGKIVGFTCGYLPEEVVHAAGILAYRISPTGCSDTALADAHLSPYSCSFCRSCLQFAADGKLGFLDGMVGMNGCDHLHRLYESWRVLASPSFTRFLSVPHRTGQRAEAWFREEVAALTASLETAFGRRISDEALRASIGMYCETRRLLRELALILEGSAMLRVLLAGHRLPREIYNELLRRALGEACARASTSDGRPRVLLAGGPCDSPEFVELIEESGGAVVADTLCSGARTYAGDVDGGPDALASLARYYLGKPPCARMVGEQEARRAFLREFVRERRVEAVIYQRLKWCDLWGTESYVIRDELRVLDLPFIVVEREYWLSGREQLKTRVQALLEIVANTRR
jgi:benzoyl-CoA reductase/2-hydroxyglutaryl-CoA dehydratase subunit BcrC/BadD/HgdB